MKQSNAVMFAEVFYDEAAAEEWTGVLFWGGDIEFLWDFCLPATVSSLHISIFYLCLLSMALIQ